MASRLQWHQNSELPQLRVWWEDDDGNLIDFSAVDTWELKIGDAGGYAQLIKTTGIAGAAGSGSEFDVDGVPNVVVDWAPGELDIPADIYTLQITATYVGASDRVMTAPVRILPAVGDLAP